MIVRLSALVGALLIVLQSDGFSRGRAGEQIILTGREAAALRLAVDDFTRHHYSTSGDLSRYSVELHRRANQLDVEFIPDTDSRGPYPGGGTDYGSEMHYTVSLKPLKILSSLGGQ